MNTLSLSIVEAQHLLAEGKITPQALLEAHLQQIERLNPRLNALITVLDDAALETSVTPNAPLAPLPIAVKDLYETAGIRTTAGSKFFADYVPAHDAFVIQKLKQAGAVVLGKANTHEIALGVTNVNPHFGACRNPWDPARISGGSSGGSAVAVASGMVWAALGTDTGGSIRIPASLCGVVGFKPTYGRVSLRGVIPLSWNLDHAGPLTRTVRDAAWMLQVMAGYDEDDPASLRVAVDDYLRGLEAGVQGWNIAMAEGAFVETADAAVLEAVHQAAKVFERLGARLSPSNTDGLHEAALANGQMVQADAAAFHRERLAVHPEWFGEDVRQRLEAGRDLPSAEYALARRKQAEFRRRYEQFFEQVDLLLLPTTPIVAPFMAGENAVERARLLTRFTAPFNLTGLPALSLPCGFTTEGLPIGLQIVAGPWQEARVLTAAYAYEQATPWHTYHPSF